MPALLGCHTQGDTVDEVLRNVKEAVELYLETLSDEEKEELLRQRVVGVQKVKVISVVPNKFIKILNKIVMFLSSEHLGKRR